MADERKSTENYVNDNVCSSSRSSGNALEQARNLAVPTASSVTNGEVEHYQFWTEHGQLLRDAWAEYEEKEGSDDDDDTHNDGIGNDNNNNNNILQSSKFIEPTLAKAVQNTWNAPTLQNEALLQSQWKQLPGSKNDIYATQLLTPQGIQHIRQELDKVTKSGIPTRRPNGMNRFGIILDDTVDGAVCLSTLTSFCRQLVEEYVRPIGRMLFPDKIGEGDDVEMYPFTIRYKLGEDVMLKEHRDASVVTMNINLNLPGEDYGGSSLYFVVDDGEDEDETVVRRHNVTFSPGMAVVHSGALRHAALPIEAGERHNLVIWLFGREGEVRVAPYLEEEQLSVEERWKRDIAPSFI